MEKKALRLALICSVEMQQKFLLRMPVRANCMEDSNASSMESVLGQSGWKYALMEVKAMQNKLTSNAKVL